MPFHNTPLVKDLIDPATNRSFKGRGGDQVLHEDLIWESGGLRYVVPTGFVTNYASVPKCLRWIFSVRGMYNRATILHDYMYTKASSVNDRFLADAIFRVTMKELGVPLLRRVAMYYGVRIGGWTSWKTK